MNATCNLCTEEPKFSVPWDRIGKELMDAHFKEKHPEDWKEILKERATGKLT